MLAYAIRRLLLIIPTLIGIMVVNFVIIQAAPGGPIEQMIARIQGTATDVTARFGGGSGEGEAQQGQQRVGGDAEITSKYRGAQGLDPEFIRELERQYGFDKPAWERFALMMKNYAVFDFGESYFRDRDVIDLVLDKMPVSISLGLWSTLIVYLISIPLGVAKAVRDGGRFDVWTSFVVVIGDAIPGFLFAILLIILFAGGSYWQIFPLRGLHSPGAELMGWGEYILDYFWHLALPIAAMVIGGFAGLTLLTKNSFIDQISKQYVTTARAKGLTERRVLYGHVFRNAMLIVVSGFPGLFVSILFTGALFIEIIFSLDGLGLLGYEAALTRDYPVMFGTLYFFTLLGLILRLVSDLTYVAIDPRIDFEARKV